jgi:hypothetical protein
VRKNNIRKGSELKREFNRKGVAPKKLLTGAGGGFLGVSFRQLRTD